MRDFREPASRADREIKHGKWLALHDTEAVWGWGTPAGQLRAKRRSDLIVQGGRLGPGKRILEIGCGTGNFNLAGGTGALYRFDTGRRKLMARRGPGTRRVFLTQVARWNREA